MTLVDPLSNIGSFDTFATPTASAPQASGDSGGMPSFSTLGQFRAQQPQLYHAFMLAMATQICQSCQKSNDHFVAEIEKERRDDGSQY